MPGFISKRLFTDSLPPVSVDKQFITVHKLFINLPGRAAFLRIGCVIFFFTDRTAG
jgi:hypothetical protein